MAAWTSSRAMYARLLLACTRVVLIECSVRGLDWRRCAKDLLPQLAPDLEPTKPRPLSIPRPPRSPLSQISCKSMSLVPGT